MLQRILGSLLLATFISCVGDSSSAPVAPASPIDRPLDVERELAAIESLRSAFQLAIKEKRYGDLNQYKLDDFEGVSPASAEWMEYREQREARLGQFSYDSIIMHPGQTMITNDSIAIDYGTSTVYYTNDSGIPVELEDTYLVVLKKDKADDRWKMYREVASGIVK